MKTISDIIHELGPSNQRQYFALSSSNKHNNPDRIPAYSQAPEYQVNQIVWIWEKQVSDFVRCQVVEIDHRPYMRITQYKIRPLEEGTCWAEKWATDILNREEYIEATEPTSRYCG
jgi:hypothetical protein